MTEVSASYRPGGGSLALGWSPEALALLDRACERHGGMESWRSLRRVHLELLSLSGWLPKMKGVGGPARLPAAIDVFPHERRTIFSGYPTRGETSVFENGDVRIERKDGAVTSSPGHRNTFCGLAKNRRWSGADFVYFFGYALAHYLSLPFSLREGRLVACRAVRGGGILEVELPADLPTHCRRQVFHFDETSLLVRHDYCAEVVGSWARGAHFWRRYVEVDGFWVATERHVVPRLGPLLFPSTVLHATMAGARVDRDRS